MRRAVGIGVAQLPVDRGFGAPFPMLTSFWTPDNVAERSSGTASERPVGVDGTAHRCGGFPVGHRQCQLRSTKNESDVGDLVAPR